LAVNWYLVHTKPKQEKRSLENLQRQGYQCYLPILPIERLRQGRLSFSDEPLFPGYLFVWLGKGGAAAKSWAPIRSTRGVVRLVCFGTEPARVDDELIELLRANENVVRAHPDRLFKPGERVCITEAPYVGIEGIYQMADGVRRVMVLIEMLNKPVTLRVAAASLRKTG